MSSVTTVDGSKNGSCTVPADGTRERPNITVIADDVTFTVRTANDDSNVLNVRSGDRNAVRYGSKVTDSVRVTVRVGVNGVARCGGNTTSDSVAYDVVEGDGDGVEWWCFVIGGTWKDG